jgi:DNA-binding transcriptional regulator YhcF (GntR family)
MVNSTSLEGGAPDRSLATRWKHEVLFDKGFVGVPARFLELYARLKPFPLTPAEALFALQLMSYKWTAGAPFPSYQSLAERMGVSDKMVRRYAQSLEVKKYLQREMRVNQTNRFDLSGLFDALRKAVEQSRKEEAQSLPAAKIAEKGKVRRV